MDKKTRAYKKEFGIVDKLWDILWQSEKWKIFWREKDTPYKQTDDCNLLVDVLYVLTTVGNFTKLSHFINNKQENQWRCSTDVNMFTTYCGYDKTSFGAAIDCLLHVWEIPHEH